MNIKHPTLLLLTSLTLSPQIAYAHLVSTRFGEFYSGVLHPLSTLFHLLPWMAIALLVGLQKRDLSSRWALVIFPVATLFGATVGGHFSQPDWLYFLNLASFMIGILVALGLNLKPQAFITLITIFGFTHGFSNSESELNGSDFALYVAGVAVAAYLLITLLSAASKLIVKQASWGNIAVRAGGSWILAVGIMYIGYTSMIPTGLE